MKTDLSPALVSPVDSTLEARFILTRLDNTGVLVDFKTGRLYQVNGSATRICEAMLGGESIGRVADDLASCFGLSRDQAATDVRGVLDVLNQERPTRRVRGASRFAAHQ